MRLADMGNGRPGQRLTVFSCDRRWFCFHQQANVNHIEHGTEQSYRKDEETAMWKAALPDYAEKNCRRQGADPFADRDQNTLAFTISASREHRDKQDRHDEVLWEC